MYIQRKKLLDKLIHYQGKDIVKIITGIRRCGKSVLLNELYYSHLIAQGVPADHIVCVSLDEERWAPLRESRELYQFVKSKITDEGQYYVFIDEVQMAAHFEEAVNSIKSEFHADVYITGSNSKLLSHDISTIFRGRGIEIRCFPLSFAEFVSYKQEDPRDVFGEYVMFGGLPYAVTEDSPQDKAAYLGMICGTVMARDMIDRYGIRNEAQFGAIVDLLCSSIGSYVSANKIANTLKSAGAKGIASETVERYLSHITDSFLFYKAQRYDIRGREYLKTQNKYYACDLGLRNAQINFRQMEMTHAIENLVYLELLRRDYTVDIGKNSSQEIDFVASTPLGRRVYIQAAYSIDQPEVRARELGAFRSLDDGYQKVLITMDNSPFTHLENGYRMIHLYDFLLQDDILEHV